MHKFPRIKDPKFLFVYPPLQFSKDEMIRPDGTLGPAYLAAALTREGFHADILDMSTGNAKDSLDDTFFRKYELSEDLTGIGMSTERILEEVKDYDVIAVTSIFTQQTNRCFEISSLIKKNSPEKLLIAGGVNARSLKEKFLENGYDIIFLSEGEKSIVKLAHCLDAGIPAPTEINGIAFKKENDIIINPPAEIAYDLDELAMPLWEKLPLEKYWDIGRIWGGRQGWIDHGDPVKYAAIFTSRGCPFACRFCHISKEKGEEAGKMGKFRTHSVQRIERELQKLKDLKVDYLYINDDSFLGNKKRVFAILKLFNKWKFNLADVNGVNIIHLFKKNKNKLVVDEDLLEALYEAGFRKISLPFESGTQRILDKYCGSKWNINKYDVIKLIKTLNRIGICADGNFIIGFPDETLDELTNTFLLAKKTMDAGMVGCGFFMAQPFPGTVLHDESIADGQLSATWNYDDFGWSKGSLFNNPVIDKNILKYSWRLIWKLLNSSNRVNEFSSQLAEKNSQ